MRSPGNETGKWREFLLFRPCHGNDRILSFQPFSIWSRSSPFPFVRIRTKNDGNKQRNCRVIVFSATLSCCFVPKIYLWHFEQSLDFRPWQKHCMVKILMLLLICFCLGLWFVPWHPIYFFSERRRSLVCPQFLAPFRSVFFRIFFVVERLWLLRYIFFIFFFCDNLGIGATFIVFPLGEKKRSKWWQTTNDLPENPLQEMNIEPLNAHFCFYVITGFYDEWAAAHANAN